MVNINLRTDFELFEVKVSLIFLGTVGFSVRRDGRYNGRRSVYMHDLCSIRLLCPELFYASPGSPIGKCSM